MTTPQQQILRVLRNAWEQVGRGKPTALFLCAEKAAWTIQEVCSWASELPQKPKVCVCDFERQTPLMPYFPFVNILHEWARQHPEQLANVLREARVYAPHREILSRILSGKDFVRDEVLIPDELHYERHQLLNGLCRVLAVISRSIPIVVVVGALHRAHASTLRLVRALLDSASGGQILLVTTLDRYSCYASETVSEHWDAFLARLEESSFLIDVESDVTAVIPQASAFEVDVDLAADKDPIRMAVALLALEDARLWSEIRLRAQLTHDEALYPSEDRLMLNQWLGQACYYLDDIDAAISALQTAGEIAQNEQNFYQLVILYRFLALAYSRRQDVESAYHYAQKSISLAQQYGDGDQLRECIFTLYLVAQDGTRYIDRDTYKRLRDIIATPESRPKYAYFCTNAIFFPEYHEGTHELIALAEEAVQIYSELDNAHGLAVAYHRLGVAHSNLYDAERTVYYLKLSEKLRNQLGEERDVVIIANGIGHYYSLIENYVAAFSYFKKSVARLSSVKDYTVVSGTLYNLGMLYFITRNFTSAADVLSRLVKFMRILKVDEIPFHSLAKILSLLGICYVHSGQTVKAMGVLAQVRALPAARPGAGETSYYMAILQALVAASEGESEGALHWFRSAPTCLDMKVKANKRFMPQYYGDFGRFLGATGYALEAQEQFERAILTVDELGFERHRVWIEQLAASGADHPIDEIPNIALEIDPIFEVARRDIMLDRLHRKISEIRFMGQVDRLLSQHADKQALVSGFLSLLHVNLDVDVAVVCFWRDGALDLKQQIVPPQFRVADLELWIETLSRKPEPELLRMQEGGPDSVRYLVNIPVHREKRRFANLLVGSISGGFMLTEEDVGVMRLVFSQLIRMLDKFDQDRALLDRNLQLKQTLTALDNKHRELQSLQAQLVQAEKMSGLGTIVAGVAHEINNPLNFMVAGTRNLSGQLKKLYSIISQSVDDADGGEEWQFVKNLFAAMETQMNAIANGSERIQGIVSDLRMFSRFDEAEWQETDLADSIRSTLNLARASADATEIHFEVQLQLNDTVGCYAAMLNQALMSLLVNACEAIAQRDTLIKGALPGVVTVSARADADWVYVDVLDNGIGISEEIRGKIFEPFFTTKAVGRGKGLGLSTVYNIIEKHAGRVDVKSRSGEGTCVSLIIPNRRQPPLSH